MFTYSTLTGSVCSLRLCIQCGLVWAFNHDIDYIQVVTQPPESKPGSSLVLSGILDIWPNSRFPDKLLWEVKDDVSGASLHVSAIRVFFRGTDLVGILFEYGRDGMCRSAGYVSGESQVLVLEEGEIPSRLDVKVWGDDNSLIVSTVFFLPLSGLILLLPGLIITVSFTRIAAGREPSLRVNLVSLLWSDRQVILMYSCSMGAVKGVLLQASVTRRGMSLGQEL